MNLPNFLNAASLAPYIPTATGRGVTRQRAHHMVKHPQEGDNLERIKSALCAMRDELNTCIELSPIRQKA